MLGSPSPGHFSTTPVNDMSDVAVMRTCPVCEHGEARLLFVKGDLRLVCCARCGMIFANPVSSDLATGTFYDRLSASFYLSPEKLAGYYAPVRFERELALFRSFCPQGAVLDVGCSTGAFLYQLKTRFSESYSVTGMDVSGGALEHARGRGIETLPGHFLQQDFAGRRFDAITFWAVLEHLADPRRFLARAASLLAPGGCCFILVPNMNSLAVRLLGWKYRYIMPDHINYFTAASLTRLAAGEPFLKRIALRTCHFNPLVILQDWRRPHERVADEERVQLLKRTTAYKQNPWLRPLKVGYRCAERCLVAFGLADNLVMVLRKQPAGHPAN
jgi:2-polyprenyl-3-methyl-5-hydroxy-6-metoxy-1,4-benzoquinol methylase